MAKKRTWAATVAATAFSHARANALRLLSVPSQHKWKGLDRSIAQFYGAVGGVLCATLWDPGCSHNLITPEFAEVLAKKGVRWKACEPYHIQHGSGEDGGVRSAAPAVRCLKADILLKHKGLTYVAKQASFYVYPGALPDVMFSRKQLGNLTCLEQPGSKLLDWEMTEEDLEMLSHEVDAAVVQAHCGHRSGILRQLIAKHQF